MEPVTFALGGLSWVVSSVLAGAPGGSAGFVLGAVLSGVLGNEAHRLYRDATPRIAKGLRGLTLAENHDLARAVRSAQIDALERLCEDYRKANRAAWDSAPRTRPADFLDRATVFCGEARAQCNKSHIAFDLTVTETLRATFEGLLADAVPGGPAGSRTEALASLAEDAVLEEVGAYLQDISIPESFKVHFRHGTDNEQRFLGLFGAFFSELIKPDTPARAIMTTKLLARIEGLAFDGTEILYRIETQFGALLGAIKQDTAEIRRRQDEDAAVSATRHEQLKRLVADAAGSGAPAVRAITDIRDLLRPGNPDIDAGPRRRPGVQRCGAYPGRATGADRERGSGPGPRTRRPPGRTRPDGQPATPLSRGGDVPRPRRRGGRI